MLPSGRSNPKRRRLESSESGESASVGYAHPYSEGWPHYPRTTAQVTVPAPKDVENSFSSPSTAVNSLALVKSWLDSHSTATATFTTTCLPVSAALPTSYPLSTSSFLSKVLCEGSTNEYPQGSKAWHHDPIKPVHGPQEVVCFGEVGLSANQSTVDSDTDNNMKLSGITARLDHNSPWSNATPSTYLRASLNSSFRFSGKAGAQDFAGTIVQGTNKNDTHDWTALTDALLEESGIELSVICFKDPYHPSSYVQHKAFRPFEKALDCTLSITIYGSLELSEEIGSFFQEHNVYLQDPLHCDRHVRYCNPHRLSSADLEKCIWTSDLGKPTTQLFELTSTGPTPGLLDAITSAQDLPEADQPRAIRTALAR